MINKSQTTSFFSLKKCGFEKLLKWKNTLRLLQPVPPNFPGGFWNLEHSLGQLSLESSQLRCTFEKRITIERSGLDQQKYVLSCLADGILGTQGTSGTAPSCFPPGPHLNNTEGKYFPVAYDIQLHQYAFFSLVFTLTSLQNWSLPTGLID